MAETVILKSDSTLRHQSNLGEEVAEVPFAAGKEFTVLKEWEHAYLIKDEDGKLFNLPKTLVE